MGLQEGQETKKKISTRKNSSTTVFPDAIFLSIDDFQAISRRVKRPKKKLAPGKTVVQLFYLVLFFCPLVIFRLSPGVSRDQKKISTRKNCSKTVFPGAIFLSIDDFQAISRSVRRPKKISTRKNSSTTVFPGAIFLSIDDFQAISRRVKRPKKIAPGKTVVQLFYLVLFFCPLIIFRLSPGV